jgi:hypothetical protein
MIRHNLASFPTIPKVRVGSLGNRFYEHALSATVDTAASRSVIPDYVCKALGLEPSDYKLISCFDLSLPSRSFPLHYVQIQIPGLLSMQVRACAVPRQSILLGQDVLKQLIFASHSKSAIFALGHHTVLRDFLYLALSRA